MKDSFANSVSERALPFQAASDQALVAFSFRLGISYESIDPSNKVFGMFPRQEGSPVARPHTRGTGNVPARFMQTDGGGLVGPLILNLGTGLEVSVLTEVN